MKFSLLGDELLTRLVEAQMGAGRVLFVDAAHFVIFWVGAGMIWSISRIFPCISSGRQRYNVLGTIETRVHDRVTKRTTGPINSNTICKLKWKIGRQYPDETITLVMDNSRYHRNHRGHGISGIFKGGSAFPAALADINLIERMWKSVEANCLRNRFYQYFGDFTYAIDTCLTGLNEPNREKSKSLITENVQILQSVFLVPQSISSRMRAKLS